MPESRPPPPLAIAAVLLLSPDPDRLALFYAEKLGLPLQRIVLPNVQPHWACEIRQVYFSIWPDESVDQGSAGSGGVALYVPDVQRDFDRLVSLGVPVEFAPKRTAMGIIARLRDPDGNPVELYQPLPR
jgi:catechol 2,3-dioxygenase-like lactoylglutathione lyase family enzyme